MQYCVVEEQIKKTFMFVIHQLPIQKKNLLFFSFSKWMILNWGIFAEKKHTLCQIYKKKAPQIFMKYWIKTKHFQKKDESHGLQQLKKKTSVYEGFIFSTIFLISNECIFQRNKFKKKKRIVFQHIPIISK